MGDDHSFPQLMNNKLLGLQAARGIAALAVVIFHAKLILIRFPDESYIRLPFFYDYGDIGVPFFFVISGFIISYVLDKDSFTLHSFFIKRFFRLWPTYFFCTVLYVMIYIIHRDLSSSDLGYDFNYILKSLVFFPQAKLPALHPGWSLEHEVLFYIFAALIAARFGTVAVFFGMLFIVLASVLIRLIIPSITGNLIGWDYHIFAPINLCFLFGIGLYFFWKKGPFERPDKWVSLCLILGLFAIVTAPYLVELIPNLFQNVSANRDFKSGYGRFAIESIASVVLLYGMLYVRSSGRLFKLLVYIGDRSYSLYLCHFIFIPIFQYLHREHIHWPEQFAEFLCVLFVIFSILLSIVIHWCVEKPSSYYGVRLVARNKNN